MKCSECGNDLAPGKIKRHSKYCSRECRRSASLKLCTQYNPQLILPRNKNRGAVNELLVCADLMENGFEVFRSVSQSASCDIAILSDSKLYRIEVTTGVWTRGGFLNSVPHDRNKYDVLAIVIGRDVFYKKEPKANHHKTICDVIGQKETYKEESCQRIGKPLYLEFSA